MNAATPLIPERLAVNDHLTLVALRASDAQALFALTDRNRDHLAKYLPWVDATRTAADSLAFIQQCINEREAGTGAHYGIFTDGVLVGHVSLMDVVQGHKAMLGYWLSQDAVGGGIITASVRRLLDLAFGDLKVVRVLIRCRPDNHKSAAVAKRLGFQSEGTERLGDKHGDEFFDFDHHSLLASEYRQAL